MYRGVFGCHVALILRRLRRLAALYGAAPRFVCCSATVGNPRQVRAWYVRGGAHGTCMARAWHVHGMCMCLPRGSYSPSSPASTTCCCSPMVMTALRTAAARWCCGTHRCAAPPRRCRRARASLYPAKACCLVTRVRRARAWARTPWARARARRAVRRALWRASRAEPALRDVVAQRRCCGRGRARWQRRGGASPPTSRRPCCWRSSCAMGSRPSASARCARVARWGPTPRP